MDKLAELTHGAKVVLGCTIAFLVVSFLPWQDYDGPGAEFAEAFGGDTSRSMWYGVGYLTGLIAIAIIVWQAIRLANIEVNIGLTSAAIIAGLAILLAIFTVGKFLVHDDYRTIWAWVGLILSIVIAAGAFHNFRASGEAIPFLQQAGADSGTAPAAAPAPPAAEPVADSSPAASATPAAESAPAAPAAEPEPATESAPTAEPATEPAPADPDAGDDNRA